MRPDTQSAERAQAEAIGGSTLSGSGSLQTYLGECRELVLREITELMPVTRHGMRLYELMHDYPLRRGKALRPALCIATCRALGGYLDAVLRSAAAIELYHNAFLVHDDVEDRSELRRSEPTLHRKYGVPIAVNVGDGMLAASMASLLANTETIGLGRALRVLDVISRMARESAEGQMMELDWIAHGSWTQSDAAYIRMVYKKTTWYSFITPVRVGAIAAGASAADVNALERFATCLGIAFQIQDDVLNLEPDAGPYGKESAGDLWEGKHTLILLHTLRRARAHERAEASRILKKPRPPTIPRDVGGRKRARLLLRRLERSGRLTRAECRQLSRAIGDGEAAGPYKTAGDIAFLRGLIDRYGGIAYALRIADGHADRAERAFARIDKRLASSAHADFLRGLVTFVVRRTW